MINFGGSDLQGIYSGDNKIASVYHGDVKLWPTEIDFSSGYWSSELLPTRPVPLTIDGAPNVSEPPNNSSREKYVRISARGDRVVLANIYASWDLNRQSESHRGIYAFERTGGEWSETGRLELVHLYDSRSWPYPYTDLVGTYSNGYYYRSAAYAIKIKFPQTDIPHVQDWPITNFEMCAASRDGDLVVVKVQPSYTSGWASRNPPVFALLRWSDDDGDYVFVDGSDSFGVPGHVMPEIAGGGSRLFVSASKLTDASVNVIDIDGDSYSHSATLTPSDFGFDGYSQTDSYSIRMRKLASSGNGQTIALADRGFSDLKTGRVGVMKFDGSSWQRAGDVLSSGLSTYGYNTDYFGESLDLSDDGNVLVVGSYRAENDGVVQVFRFVDGGWEAMGNAIRVDEGRYFGRQVAISGNGLVVSALSMAPSSFYEYPQVRTFHWNGSDWAAAGDPLYNPNRHPFMNNSITPPGISLSRDGSALAVGWEWATGGKTGKGCRVYRWNSTGAAS